MKDSAKKCTPTYPELSQVRVDGGFFAEWLQMIRTVSAKDIMGKFFAKGTIGNYERAAQGTGKHIGSPWHHGLICECIRGMSDMLVQAYDPVTDEMMDGIIALMAEAQDADPEGYINPYTTLVCPAQRWGRNGGNAVYQHEIYNAGCLAEAGVHHYKATGKTSLLRIAVRMCNYLADFIGDAPKHNVVSEHSIAEKAFLKMYSLFTDDAVLAQSLHARADEYLRLSRYLIDHKGDHETRYTAPRFFRDYAQDHRPAREQREAVGHAVRATLFYEGMTALAMEDDDAVLAEACRSIWQDIVCTKLHINGAVGAHKNEEKFGMQYELPNDAYLETCAGVGLSFFGMEMFKLTKDASVWDVVESTLYNLIPTSVSADGVKYTYENPLQSQGDYNRWAWHGCPCCPPMLLKIAGTLPSMIFAECGADVWLNLHIDSTLTRPDAKLRLAGKKLTVTAENPVALTLHIRIPDWCRGFGLLYNGEKCAFAVEKGYAVLPGTFSDGDTVEFVYTVPVVKYIAHPYVKADHGRIAVKHGPTLYCAEAIDNAGADTFEAFDFALSDTAPLSMDGEGNIIGTRTDGAPCKLVPYYSWNNRGAGFMRVWLRQAGYVADVMNVQGWEGKLYRPYAEYEV